MVSIRPAKKVCLLYNYSVIIKLGISAFSAQMYRETSHFQSKTGEEGLEVKGWFISLCDVLP